MVKNEIRNFNSEQAFYKAITEKQAKDQGLEIETVKVNFSAQNFRAAASNKMEGFIKVVTMSDGTIVGATIVGASASDLISEFMLAIKKKMTAKEMSELIYVHPSFSEAIQNSLEKIQGQSITWKRSRNTNYLILIKAKLTKKRERIGD